ncbi:DoxX family protein [Nonomuraea sp. NPDC003804]|uniref:DoxX family protein n=1 Tax=Nonomuraea sp. NPDC003804 TaxID=3154547 RepID=UPI0033A3016D
MRRTLHDLATLAARLGVGGLFFANGWHKLEVGLTATGAQFAAQGAPAPGAWAAITMLTELIGGALLVAGLFTPVLGLLLFAETLAVFLVARPLNPVDTNLVVALGAAAVLLAVTGAGRISVDHMVVIRRREAQAADEFAADNEADSVIDALREPGTSRDRETARDGESAHDREVIGDHEIVRDRAEARDQRDRAGDRDREGSGGSETFREHGVSAAGASGPAAVAPGRASRSAAPAAPSPVSSPASSPPASLAAGGDGGAGEDTAPHPRPGRSSGSEAAEPPLPGDTLVAGRKATDGAKGGRGRSRKPVDPAG